MDKAYDTLGMSLCSRSCPAAVCAEQNCLPFAEKTHRFEGHWAIVDLVGKGNHVRTDPMPGWVKNAIDRW